MLKKIIISTIVLASFFSVNAQYISFKIIDTLTFGSSISETKHSFGGELSKTVIGALKQSARVLLPRYDKTWQGGSMSFVVKVDSVLQNYITTRFWGSEINSNRLHFVVGNKQIGSRHLGEIDMLDIGADHPVYNERFFYTTLPLPLSLTQGKTELRIEIRSQGRIWGYGNTWDKYQYAMTEPSRTIYKVYTHTSGAFTPPKDELQGNSPKEILRTYPGKEVLEKVKERVNNEITKLRKSIKPLNQMQIQFLAKAYRVKWSFAYKDKEVVEQVLWGLDNLCRTYRVNKKIAYSDPATPNPDWFGLGAAAEALHLLFAELESKMDEKIDDGLGVKIKRRIAFVEMFLAARKANQTTRRSYTNQTMIKDLYGIYLSNKGLQILKSDSALPEKAALRYLYEAMGAEPWRGSDQLNQTSDFSQGNNYWQLTNKGLTKELGFVGSYGEVIDWASLIYDASRPQPNQEGDSIIKKQVEKIALARSYFRYPMLDDEKYKAMRQEVIVGWRDDHYPGPVVYAQKATRESGTLEAAAFTMNSKLIAYCHQMFNDNQFFYSLEEKMKESGFRVTAGLLNTPEQYELIKNQKPSTDKLPMSWDQPDIVFADEDDGVIAIKNGKEILYASLYWRARHAINNLARVHYITPNYDRVATVSIIEKLDSSGYFFTVPDYTNFGFAKGGIKYPDSLHLAHAGEKQPIAKIPEDIPYKLGQEHPLAGRANLYQMQYGKYFVVMNASANKVFTINLPIEFKNAINIATKEKNKSLQLHISPKSTVVLYNKN